MNQVHVDLGQRSYDIHIASGLLQKAGETIRTIAPVKRVALITDTTVDQLYGTTVLNSLERSGFVCSKHCVPDGESSKSYRQLETLHSQLIESGLTRDSLIVALGGGVVGDLAGFTAATYLRGVPFVQIPTSLLAQVDSSVGGKTGINHSLGKNLVGSFFQPLQVLIDPEVLKTLDKRDLWGGLAEVVKYGLIRDATFFDFLENNLEDLFFLRNMKDVIHAVSECCRIKAEVVRLDEKESGLRRILNFGHTLGHAIEAVTGYRTFRHGEAVAYGMDWAAWQSLQEGLTSETVYQRIIRLLSRFDLPPLPANLQAVELLEKMGLDKKQTASGLYLVLIDHIGSTHIQKAKHLKSSIEGWLNHVR